MRYPDALGQRPLAVDEAYQALQAFAAQYGRGPLLLLMHAAVPETLRVDLLALIRLNFLPEAADDLSLDADVLFAPPTTALGGGYFRIDPQVRWHALGLLRSLYRDEPRPRQRRIAELLWRYTDDQAQHATRAGDPLLADYLDIQRWVALAFLAPGQAAAALAQVLRQDAASAQASPVLLRLGGLVSAIELPLAGQQDLLAYARGLHALAQGDDEQARQLLAPLGPGGIEVGGVVLKPPAGVLRRRVGPPAAAPAGQAAAETAAAGPAGPTVATAPQCLVISAGGEQSLVGLRRRVDLDRSFDRLQQAARQTGARCARIRDLAYPGNLSEGLYRALVDARLVVVDLSVPSTEVMCLLGMALALRPDGALLICQQDLASELDLDLGTFGLRPRSYPAPGDVAEDAVWRDLGQDIAALLAGKIAAQSPVYQRLPGLLPPRWIDDEPTDPPAPKGVAQDICLLLYADERGRQVAGAAPALLGREDVRRPLTEMLRGLGLQAVDTLQARAAPGPKQDPMAGLQTARLVIVDLSALPPGSELLLGMRLALRRSGTLLLARSTWPVPASLYGLDMLHYPPDDANPAPGHRSAMLEQLGERLQRMLHSPRADSPVYRALPKLQPPQWRLATDAEAARSPAPARLRVFISYVHEYRPLVSRLIKALLALEIAVDWDMNLKPGADFDAELRAMLDRADAVVAVCGRLTDGRPFPVAEAGRALALGKRLVPLYVDHFDRPAVLSQRQAANLDNKGRIAYLADLKGAALDRVLQRSAASIVKLLQAPPDAQPQRAGADSPRALRVSQPIPGELQFEASSPRARQQQTLRYQPPLIQKLIDQLQAGPQLDVQLVATLAQLLLPQAVADDAEPSGWQLLLPPTLWNWPWELLLSHRRGQPLLPASVFRLAELPDMRPQLPASVSRQALVISNPATARSLPDQAAGLPPLPGASAEGRAVAAALSAAGLQPTVSDGEAAEAVLAHMFARPYQVLLITGHAVQQQRLADGRRVSGIVLSDGFFLTANELQAMNPPPALVMLNASHIGRSRAGSDGPTASWMVMQLLQAGVRCVVAPSLAVDDRLAALFATRFFEALGSGLPAEPACALARRAVFDTDPLSPTWGAYQACGDADFVLRQGAAR